MFNRSSTVVGIYNSLVGIVLIFTIFMREKVLRFCSSAVHFALCIVQSAYGIVDNEVLQSCSLAVLQLCIAQSAYSIVASRHAVYCAGLK
jgi:hypothetical protein